MRHTYPDCARVLETNARSPARPCVHVHVRTRARTQQVPSRSSAAVGRSTRTEGKESRAGVGGEAKAPQVCNKRPGRT